MCCVHVSCTVRIVRNMLNVGEVLNIFKIKTRSLYGNLQGYIDVILTVPPNFNLTPFPFTSIQYGRYQEKHLIIDVTRSQRLLLRSDLPKGMALFWPDRLNIEETSVYFFGTSKQPPLGCPVCVLLRWGTQPRTGATGSALVRFLPPDLGKKEIYLKNQWKHDGRLVLKGREYLYFATCSQGGVGGLPNGPKTEFNFP